MSNGDKSTRIFRNGSDLQIKKALNPRKNVRYDYKNAIKQGKRKDLF